MLLLQLFPRLQLMAQLVTSVQRASTARLGYPRPHLVAQAPTVVVWETRYRLTVSTVRVANIVQTIT